MIGYSLLPSKKLTDCNAEHRDALLTTELGISETNLRSIRKRETIEDRLLLAGKELRRALEQKYGGNIVLSSQFTNIVLAAIVSDNWENPIRENRDINRVLQQRYAEKCEVRSRLYGLQIPVTQAFREEVGVYTGNIYDTKLFFPWIDASNTDFLRSVNVPLVMNGDLAFLAGLGQVGAAIQKREQTEKSYSISFRGGKVRKGLYGTILTEILAKYFNVHLTPRITLQGDANFNNYVLKNGGVKNYGSYPAESTTIAVSSLVVTMYLIYHLGFSAKYSVPESVDGHLDDFFSGLVSTMPKDRNGVIYQTDSDGEKLHFIQNIGKELGYNSSMSHDANFFSDVPLWRLSFSQEQADKILDDGLYKNPR